ncbi:MAG: hypothetical protein JWP02_2493 [Acidimicrobiales bacterium]|nr:hypothetical protein [Acidimicrobiales bacterium]
MSGAAGPSRRELPPSSARKMRVEALAFPPPRRHSPSTITAGPASTRTAGLGLDLYWIPLGAGANVVRVSGRIFEALSAFLHRRPRRDLYHSALVAVTTDGTFAIEMTPVPDSRGDKRGVVAEGPVGTKSAGRLRVFRYEIHRWRDGVIPDISWAVASPVRICGDDFLVRKLLDLVPLVPTPVWGRDELGAGEMWNSNSVTAWLLASAGLDAAAGRPPNGGRAPGWDAGVTVAQRSIRSTSRVTTPRAGAGRTSKRDEERLPDRVLLNSAREGS